MSAHGCIGNPCTICCTVNCPMPQAIVLSAQDFDRVLAMLDEEPNPTPAMRELFALGTDSETVPDAAAGPQLGLEAGQPVL